MGQSKPFNDAFDPEQISLLESVLSHAWSIVSFNDKEPDDEARELLALCIVTEMRAGETNYVKLVNQSIVQFRALRFHRLKYGRASAVPDSDEAKLPD